jgi:hypothetical protein
MGLPQLLSHPLITRKISQKAICEAYPMPPQADLEEPRNHNQQTRTQLASTHKDATYHVTRSINSNKRKPSHLRITLKHLDIDFLPLPRNLLLSSDLAFPTLQFLPNKLRLPFPRHIRGPSLGSSGVARKI